MLRTTGYGSRNTPGALIEFRAGKMYLKGKIVYPDKRKGLCFLRRAPDDLVHFCWKDRRDGQIEDDLIIFPNDFELIKVPQCKTGRVFLLKGITSKQRNFYWLQEPNANNDEEIFRRVNSILNDPFTASSHTESEEIDLVLQNMSPQEITQLYSVLKSYFGLNPEQEHNPETDTNIQTEIYQQTGSSTAGGTADTNNQKLVVDLSTSIENSSDIIQNLLKHSNNVQLLSQHLPNIHDNEISSKENILENIGSPQFQQALSIFSTQFSTGELSNILKQFDLPADAIEAANIGDLLKFVIALDKLKNVGRLRSE